MQAASESRDKNNKPNRQQPKKGEGNYEDSGDEWEIISKRWIKWGVGKWRRHENRFDCGIPEISEFFLPENYSLFCFLFFLCKESYLHF